MFQLPAVLSIRPIQQESVRIRCLLASIIRRAAFDIALYKNDHRLTHKRFAVSAKRWMFDDSDAVDPLDRFTSFLSICEILDEDPGWIREQTLRLRRADVKRFVRVET